MPMIENEIKVKIQKRNVLIMFPPNLYNIITTFSHCSIIYI